MFSICVCHVTVQTPRPHSSLRDQTSLTLSPTTRIHPTDLCNMEHLDLHNARLQVLSFQILETELFSLHRKQPRAVVPITGWVRFAISINMTWEGGRKPGVWLVQTSWIRWMVPVERFHPDPSDQPCLHLLLLLGLFPLLCR